jgi:hypothetical protein
LAESVHASFVESRRAAGLSGLSDGEVYRSFDLTYDYDIWPIWEAAVQGRVPVARYLEMVRFQDAIYPANYVKMRCVENHDRARITAFAPSREQALAWTAFEAFNKGAFLIYAGQESAATHTPSLFDIDKVEWGAYGLQPFLTRLALLKKDPAQQKGQFSLLASEPVVQAAWQHHSENLYGLFNVDAVEGEAAVRLPDGQYEDLLNDTAVVVRDGRLAIPQSATILRYEATIELALFHSVLLDD